MNLVDLDTEPLHEFFPLLPVEDTCTWYGTQYKGDGVDSVLLACGAPTIGAAVFCDPTHSFCSYFSVCERHKGTMPFWGEA